MRTKGERDGWRARERGRVRQRAGGKKDNSNEGASGGCEKRGRETRGWKEEKVNEKRSRRASERRRRDASGSYRFSRSSSADVERTKGRGRGGGNDEGRRGSDAYAGATNFQRRRRRRRHRRRRQQQQHLKLHARQINPPESEALFPDCASRPFYLYLNLKMERSRERTEPYTR